MSHPATRRRTFATIEAIVVLAAVIALQYVVAGSGRKPALSDFRVVYCAERAVMQRADPYRAEPLRTCENAVHPEAGHTSWMVTPFPLPGYTAAIFFPLGLLPFRLAEIAWLALLVLAFAIASAILAELVETRVWPIALVLAPSVGVLNLAYGEPVDIAIAAICIAALYVVRDRPRIAAFAAAAATIEPHVGLPACIGLFVAMPRARIPLVALGALFALVSIATLGMQNNIEYFATFLPLQAHAEVYAADQYSLTRVLFLIGFSPDIALLRGTISYFVMMVVGVFAARRMVELGVSRAVAILVPVSTAMFGGTFIHDVEIAAALPAAIVLARRSVAARIAVSLLAMRWGYTLRGVIGLIATATVGVVTFALPRAAVWQRLVYAGITIVVLAAIDVAVVPHVHAQALRGVPGVAMTPTTISSIPWEWSIRLAPVSLDFDPRQLWLKVPTWLALLAVPASVLELEARSARKKSA